MRESICESARCYCIRRHQRWGNGRLTVEFLLMDIRQYRGRQHVSAGFSAFKALADNRCRNINPRGFRQIDDPGGTAYSGDLSVLADAYRRVAEAEGRGIPEDTRADYAFMDAMFVDETLAEVR